MVRRPAEGHARPMDRPDPAAALHRVLGVLLVPAVLAGGWVASTGDAAARSWGIGVALAVLAVGAIVVAVGVRALWRERAANAPLVTSRRPSCPCAPPDRAAPASAPPRAAGPR